MKQNLTVNPVNKKRYLGDILEDLDKRRVLLPGSDLLIALSNKIGKNKAKIDTFIEDSDGVIAVDSEEVEIRRERG